MSSLLRIHIFSVLTFTLTLSPTVRAWPFGALPDSCDSMSPGHGKEPPDPNPYYLDVAQEGNSTNGTISVTIGGEAFQGLLLIARVAGTSDVVGFFTKPGGAVGLHPLDCGGKPATALTQSNPSNRQDVTVIWNPPAKGQGRVEFVATIHKEKNIWWKNTKSDVLEYSGTGLGMRGDGDDMTESEGGGAQRVTGTGLAGVLCLSLVTSLVH